MVFRRLPRDYGGSQLRSRNFEGSKSARASIRQPRALGARNLVPFFFFFSFGRLADRSLKGTLVAGMPLTID